MSGFRHHEDASLEVVDSHIKKLENLAATVQFEGECARLLYNPATQEHCQIFEYLSCSGKKSSYVPDHVHKISDELFYVVLGKLTFSDGEVLNMGQFRLIPAGTVHGCNLSKGGKAIVIARPPAPEYEMVGID